MAAMIASVMSLAFTDLGVLAFVLAGLAFARVLRLGVRHYQVPRSAHASSSPRSYSDTQQ